MKSLYTWIGIWVVVFSSSAGDVLIAAAMKRVGDVGDVYARLGLWAVARRIATSGLLLAGIACMAVAFFSLLFALSWGDVSLVAPASASLTFVVTAILAQFFLGERVDARRWVATALVSVGVVLLTY